MLFVYQGVLWGVFLLSYIALRYFFGSRIYFSEQKYVTVREIMLPLLVILFETSSRIIFGYSWMSLMAILCALVGLLLLSRRGKQDYFNVKVFLHQYCSIVFLLFEIGTLLLQLGRIF